MMRSPYSDRLSQGRFLPRVEHNRAATAGGHSKSIIDCVVTNDPVGHHYRNNDIFVVTCRLCYGSPDLMRGSGSEGAEDVLHEQDQVQLVGR